jgi:hypothetical protein
MKCAREQMNRSKRRRHIRELEVIKEGRFEIALY